MDQLYSAYFNGFFLILAPDSVLFWLLLITMIQWYSDTQKMVGCLLEKEKNHALYILRSRTCADRRPMSQFFLRLTTFQLRYSKTTKSEKSSFFTLAWIRTATLQDQKPTPNHCAMPGPLQLTLMFTLMFAPCKTVSLIGLALNIVLN
jgi:hypothetical protein